MPPSTDPASSDSPSSASYTQAHIPTEAQTSHQDDVFTLTDIKLFHHFSTTTCRYMANPNEPSPWPDTMMGIATDHAFLTHAVMAVAALDLSVNNPSSDSTLSSTYLDLAHTHHAKALAGLTPAITSQSPALVQVVWACNSLFVPYYFATTADAASLLFTADPPGPAEWMLPLRGGVTLFNSHAPVLMQGPVGQHLRSYIDRCRDGEAAVPNNLSEPYVTQMVDRLQGEQVGWSEGEKDVLARTCELLRQCFATSDQGDAMGRKTASLWFCATAPAGFFEMLGCKRRAALVVMAFWCVLLHRAEQGRWWMSLRKERGLLGCVAELLGPEGRDLIRWPLEEIGITGGCERIPD